MFDYNYIAIYGKIRTKDTDNRKCPNVGRWVPICLDRVVRMLKIFLSFGIEHSLDNAMI